MSLEAQWRALYRLLYKRDAREAFLGGGEIAVAGLTESAAAQLRAVPAERLRRVVELHATDIGFNWYRPRVPGTWLALQGSLEVDEAELATRLAQSEAFETRVDDDADGRALAGFIEGEASAGRLAETPWIGDLLRYELLIAGIGLAEGEDRVEEFSYDVSAIRESLLQDSLCPTDEPETPVRLRFHRDAGGVEESPA